MAVRSGFPTTSSLSHPLANQPRFPYLRIGRSCVQHLHVDPDSATCRPRSVFRKMTLIQDGPIEDAAGKFESGKVIFALSASKPDAGYLIYSLSESADHVDTDMDADTDADADADADSSSGQPFTLSVRSVPQLPHAFSPDLLLDRVPQHLLADRQAVHVVVSTRSGLCRAEAFYKNVLKPLLTALDLDLGPAAGGLTVSRPATENASHTCGYHVLITENSGSIRALAGRLGRDETVILLSGDGGVVELLNGIPYMDGNVPVPTVALLPLGTANALLHSLYRPQYVRDKNTTLSPLVLALRTLFRGSPAALPTFQATFSPGSYLARHDASEARERIDCLCGAIVASYGLHASLVWESDTPAYRAHGHGRFGMAARALLREGHAYAADVCVQPVGSHTRERLRGGRDYVLATLVSNLERTLTISPASTPLDGRLRLVHFGHADGDRVLEIMQMAYQGGEHVGMRWGEGEGEMVGYEEVEEVRVDVREEEARWRKVCIDGTIVELGRGGWMSVKKVEGERLRVLVDRTLDHGAGIMA